MIGSGNTGQAQKGAVSLLFTHEGPVVNKRKKPRSRLCLLPDVD